MKRHDKARFSKGALIPQERPGLEEGSQVAISIADPSPERTLDALRATAGAWKGTHSPENLKQALCSDRLATPRPQPKL